MPMPIIIDQDMAAQQGGDAGMIGANRPSQGAPSAREPYSETDVVNEQLDVWVRDREPHRIWAERAVRCVNYMRGQQWDEKVVRELAAQGRPALTFNNIRPLARLLIGYYLQNRADVRYLPTSSGGATQAIAEALTHTLKQADEDCGYRWMEGAVYRDGLIAGRGYLDARIGFDRNVYGEIEQVDVDPFLTYIDCDATSFNIAKHQHVTLNRYMSLEDVLLQFGSNPASKIRNLVGASMPVLPDSTLGDGDNDDVTPARAFGLNDYLRSTATVFMNAGAVRGTFPAEHVDRQRKILRVLDRQHQKLRRVRYIVDIQTGDKIEVPWWWNEDRLRFQMQQSAASGFELTVIDGLKPSWRWTITCLDQVLWDDWSPYDEPTLIGYFPYFERGITPSFADDLIDPQNEINKRRSALIHSVMSSANPGWMYEEGTLDEDMQLALEREGSAPGVIIKWRRLSPNSQPPKRIEPGMPPQGLRLLEREAQEDMRVISGINESAMGRVDKVQSGRAIEARQRQAVVTHEQVFDNMSQFRELRGTKCLKLIQGFYTQKRLIRTIGEGNRDQQTMINDRIATGAIVNDVTLGRYRTAVDEAPASATFLAAQFDEAMQMVEKGLIPPTMADIIIDLSTMPRKEEIKNRLQQDRDRQMMAQGGGGMAPPGAPQPGLMPPPQPGPGVPPMAQQPPQQPGMPMVPGMPPAGPQPSPEMPTEMRTMPPQPGLPTGFDGQLPPPANPAPAMGMGGGQPMVGGPAPVAPMMAAPPQPAQPGLPPGFPQRPPPGAPPPMLRPRPGA